MESQNLRETFCQNDIRAVIKFLFLLGKSPAEVHNDLEKGLQEHAPSYETVRRWMRRFMEGRTSTDDDPRSGRPLSATSHDVVRRVAQLLDEDRRVTCEEVANSLKISSDSAHRILRENLGKRKIAAKWVPHMLTEDQKVARMTISAAHLHRFRQEGDAFLNRIVACDETWAHSFEPELKRQSAEWIGQGSPRPVKAIRARAAIKVMHITFFDKKGILFDHAVPPRTTVNGDYYLNILRTGLRQAIRRKRPELIDGKIILLQDNAGPHRKKEVLEAMESWGWEVLAHPPYSPDLSPCDFFLFPRVKESLRGVRFEDADAINRAFRNSLQQQGNRGTEGGIFGLVPRWKKCIDLNGDYVE